MTPNDWYRCDRCDTPTRPEFLDMPEFVTQLRGGLHLDVAGYDGGFYDSLAFMGHPPVSVHLCHDCCLWLVREIPKLSKESKGGHPVDLMDATDENPCCEFAWSPTPVEAIVHSQPDLNDVMRRGEETRG
jgi:hypothetical protein